jgi:hypothetical protein
MIVLLLEQRRMYTGGAESARNLHAREAGANNDDMLFLISFGHGNGRSFGKWKVALSKIYVRATKWCEITLPRALEPSRDLIKTVGTFVACTSFM